jgi:hypothetical protein
VGAIALRATPTAAPTTAARRTHGHRRSRNRAFRDAYADAGVSFSSDGCNVAPSYLERISVRRNANGIPFKRRSPNGLV